MLKLTLYFVTMLIFFPVSGNAKNLLVLGDSISEGYGVSREQAYPTLLQEKILKSGKKDWTVINSSVSGSTSASALGRLKWAIKNKPQVLLLALGANDGLRGIKNSEMKKNLASTIEFAQSQKIQVVLAGMHMPPNYGKEYTQNFHQVFVDLQKQYSLKFIPFLLDKVGGIEKLNQTDGIHPNVAGHKIIAETVFASLKDIL